jgi:hypothetical protein
MGDCKTNMTTSKSEKVKAKSGLLGVLPRRKKREDVASAPKRFADILEEADLKLNDLITIKTADLKHEKGSEDYNQQALALLKTMQFHLDGIIDLVADYAELK